MRLFCSQVSTLVHLPLLAAHHVECREPATVVAAGVDADQMAEVENGHLRFVFNDGRGPKSGDMRPVEREELSALRESRADLLNH